MFLAVMGESKVWINIDEILFMESKNKQVYVYTSNNVHKCSLTLSYIENNMNVSFLVRTHRSYIVNLDKMTSFEYYADRSMMIRFLNIKNVAFVSRSYLKSFLKRLNDSRMIINNY